MYSISFLYLCQCNNSSNFSFLIFFPEGPKESRSDSLFYSCPTEQGPKTTWVATVRTQCRNRNTNGSMIQLSAPRLSRNIQTNGRIPTLDPARLPTLSCSAQRQFDWFAQLRRFRELSAAGRTLRLLALQGTNHRGVTKNQHSPDLQVMHTQTHTGRQAQLYTHTQCNRQVGFWQRSRAG